MAIAIALWFEPELEDRLRALWRGMAEAGVESPLFDGRYRPHVTLSVWDDVRPEPFEDALGRWAADTPAFPVRFDNVGLFREGEGVAFLQAVVTEALLAIHREVHDIARRFGTSAAPLYEPGVWIPHCTMAWKAPRAQIMRAADYLLSNALPLEGRVTALGIVDTPAEVELKRFQLQI